MDTVCKDCVFAAYDKNTQTGCFHDRINLYDKAGYNVQGAYDNNREFYIIEGAVCNKFRTSKWADSRNLEDIDKRISKCNEESAFNYDVMLYVDVFNLERFEEQLGRLSKLEPQLNKLLVLTPPYLNIQDEKAADFIKILNKFKFKKWKLENFLHTEQEKTRHIDLAELDVESKYYVVFNLSYGIPLDYAERVDEFLNVKLRPMVMLFTDNSYHGLVVQNFIHKFVNGHKHKSLVDAVRELDTGEKKCLIKIEEIYPTLPW